MFVFAKFAQLIISNMYQPKATPGGNVSDMGNKLTYGKDLWKVEQKYVEVIILSFLSSS